MAKPAPHTRFLTLPILLYGDESEALTHPYLARAWAKAGADLRVPAPGQAKKVAMLGRSIASRANSSSIPARPSAAATSSPIWSNSTVSLDRSPGDRQSRSCWSRTMVQSTPANARSPLSPPAHTGSPSSGWQNTPRNSTKSSRSGAILRPITSPTRPSQTSPPSTRPSMTPSSISTASASPIRWPRHEFCLAAQAGQGRIVFAAGSTPGNRRLMDGCSFGRPRRAPER